MAIGTSAIVNAIYQVAQAFGGRKGAKAPRIEPKDLMPDFSGERRRPKAQTAKMARAALLEAFAGKVRRKGRDPSTGSG